MPSRGTLRMLRATAAAAASLAAVSLAHGQPRSGYLAADDGSTYVPAAQLRNLLVTKLSTAPTLIVFNQCFGGNCATSFSTTSNVCVLSATSPNQLSIVPSYDAGAAFGLRANPSPRTARDTHNEGVAAQMGAGAPAAGMTPMTTGLLLPENFELLGVDTFSQSRVSIVFYAGKAEDVDQQRLGLIREFYPSAKYYVLGSGPLESDPDRIGPAGVAELEAALTEVADPIIINETVIMWVGGHGGLYTGPSAPETALPNIELMVPTEPLPQSDGDAINSAPAPAPGIVLEIPAQQAGLMLAASDPPMFASTDWSVSVPLTMGTSSSSMFREERFDGGDGIVGDDPDDIVQISFLLPAASFIDAFVGRPNVVTVTNRSGQAWPIRLLLDIGPVPQQIPPEPCIADFNQSGGLTVQDIFDFLAAYFGNDPAADFNFSGTITVQDIFDYLEAYFVGCP